MSTKTIRVADGITITINSSDLSDSNEDRLESEHHPLPSRAPEPVAAKPEARTSEDAALDVYVSAMAVLTKAGLLNWWDDGHGHFVAQTQNRSWSRWCERVR